MKNGKPHGVGSGNKRAIITQLKESGKMANSIASQLLVAVNIFKSLRQRMERTMEVNLVL